MNAHAKYINKLKELQRRLIRPSNPWPPMDLDLMVAIELLSNREDAKSKKMDESDSELLTRVMKNEDILQLLQYLTVLHLTLSDVFSWDPLGLNNMKYEYERYKKDARRIWGWTSGGVNFKSMVENGTINKMDITPFTKRTYCLSPVDFDMFLNELSNIIDRARKNITEIRKTYVYSEEKKSLLGIYDKIYYLYLSRKHNGGKHTSRKNRTKRKHRTRKH